MAASLTLDESGAPDGAPPNPAGGAPLPPNPGAPVPMPPNPGAPVPMPAAPGLPALSGPVPVILVAPVPLPVTIVGGMPAGGEGAPKKEPMPQPAEWAKWFAELAGTGVRRAGIAASGAANGSVMPALGTAVEGAVAGLSKLGPYGMAAAAGVKVFSEAVTAVKETMDGLVRRGRELAPYSGTLSASAARADVRKLVSDIGEAERIGPQLARLIDAQSRAEAMQQRLLEPIKSFLSERLTVLLEQIMQAGIGTLEAVNALPGIRGDFSKLINELKGIYADSGDTTALVEKWVRGFGGPFPAPVAPAARPGTRPAPLGIPLV